MKTDEGREELRQPQASVTARLAEFIVRTGYEDIPAEVVRLAKNSFLDTLGITLAGSVEEAPSISSRFAKKAGGSPVASVIGKGFKNINSVCNAKGLAVRRSFKLLVLAVVACFVAGAQAQNYPAKPVRMVVPGSPGGGTDLIARAIADKLSEAWGQQFVVDNRSGAGGMIGAEVVARAAPDGYTLLVPASSSVSIGPHLVRKPRYDPLRDFAPVILIASAPLALVVHPSMPVKSLRELITLAKTRPGEINYASGGSGSYTHLVMELFKLQAHIDILHVPYNGGTPQVLSVVSGETSALFSSLPLLFGHLRTGRLKGLAVTSLQRVAVAPELPTVAETLPGFETSQWWGMYAPARTPIDIIDKLNGEVAKILNHPDLKRSFAVDGSTPKGGSPRDFAAFQKAEHEKWGRVIKQIGIRLD